MTREPAQRLLAAAAVALDIEDDVDAPLLAAAVGREIREILERVERLPVLADEDAEALAAEVVDIALVRLPHRERHREPHAAEDIAQELLRARARRPCRRRHRRRRCRLDRLRASRRSRCSSWCSRRHVLLLLRHAQARHTAAEQAEKPARRLLDHLVIDLVHRASERDERLFERLLDGLARLDDRAHASAPFFFAPGFSSPRYIHHCCAIWQKFIAAQ